MRLLPALLVLACGCSIVGLRGPASTDPGVPVRCTDPVVPPIVDTIFAAAGVAGLVLVAIDERRANHDAFDALGDKIVGVPSALAVFVGGASAVYGFGTVSACRAARARYDARQQGQ